MKWKLLWALVVILLIVGYFMAPEGGSTGTPRVRRPHIPHLHRRAR